MAKKSFSFLIISHRLGSAKTVFVPQWFWRFVFFSVFGIVVFCTFSVVQHLTYFSRLKRIVEPTLAENNMLREEKKNFEAKTAGLHQQIAQLNDQLLRERKTHRQSLSFLNGQLSSLKRFSTKLKILSGFKLSAEECDSLGMGGPAMNLDMTDFLEAKTIAEMEDNLRREMREQYGEFQEIWDYLETKKSLLGDTPELAPLFGKLTSKFGARRWKRSRHTEGHAGIDIAVPRGTAVLATADGVATWVGWKGDYGNLIELDHGNDYTTRYGHLSRFNIKTGDRVRKGEIIGYSGNTGRSTGPHLHYEVRISEIPVDPIRYLKKRGNSEASQNGE
ncbi:MAG: peptidoglycan DD-metalloendopeptidase family protein [Candidatus Edwardsbacteria bacterium]